MGTPRKIQEKKNERRERLQSSLNSIIRQLKDLGALKIVLFGSFARDDVDATSDLDLLVLMPSTSSGKVWMSRIYNDVKREVAADILVFTEEEFEDADELRKRGRYYLALFHYQQSAEKALEAFLYSRTAALEVLYTHSVDELVRMAVESDGCFEAVETAKKLDQYYISTRYPNGLPGGIPSQFYDDPDEAEAAMRLAKSVIDLVTEKVPLS